MIFNLLAIAILGVVAAAVVALAFKVTGRKAPRWSLPAAAGVTMLIFTLWSEYSWLDRTVAVLPERVAVAQTYGHTHPLQPWTYVVAPVNRFVAVDREGRAAVGDSPRYVAADVLLVQRWTPTRTARMVFDCERPRRADAVDVEGLDEAGEPAGARWIALDAEDPMRAAAREGREAATAWAGGASADQPRPPGT
jgi:hypothetical protein